MEADDGSMVLPAMLMEGGVDRMAVGRLTEEHALMKGWC